MRKLTEQEKEARNDTWNKLLDLDDDEVIFDSGFLAGLEAQDARIAELEDEISKSIQLARNLTDEILFLNRRLDSLGG